MTRCMDLHIEDSGKQFRSHNNYNYYIINAALYYYVAGS